MGSPAVAAETASKPACIVAVMSVAASGSPTACADELDVLEDAVRIGRVDDEDRDAERRAAWRCVGRS